MAESIISFRVHEGSGFFTTSKMLVLFSAPFHATSSSALFPSVPIWDLIHATVQLCLCHAMFSSPSAVFKAVVYLKSILFSAWSAD